MKKKILCSIFCMLFLLTGCGKVAELKNGEQIVAKIDGKNITADDLYKSLKEKSGSSMMISLIDQFIADKEMETTEDMRTSAESTLSLYKAQYENYGQKFEDVIKSSGYSSEKEFLEELIMSEKREEVAKKYIKENLTDEEINEYYESNIFGDMTARHILITPDTKDDMSDDEKKAAEDTALQKAKDLIKQLNSGAKFEDLAKKYSDDEGSKEDGGLIKDFNKDDVVESFWNATRNLKDGEYTKEPVESDYGYHIILRVSEKEKPSLKDSESDIRESLAEEKLNSDSSIVEKTWIEIRKKYKLDIQDDEVKKGYNNIIKTYDSE